MILPRRFVMLPAILALAILILSSPMVLGESCIYYEDYVHTIGGARLFNSGEAVAVDGTPAEVAFVCLGVAGIVALDVTSNVPAILDTLRTPGFAHAIAVRDTTAWIAAGPAGILQVNISDPGNLALRGSFATEGEAWDIVLNGSLAMIAAWDAGFQLLDISDLNAPAWMGGSDLPGFGVGIAAAGNHAYVTDFVGLKVIDCSDPSSPSVVGALGISGKASDVAVLDGRAYVVAGLGGLHIIDVSNPFLPSPITTVAIEDQQLQNVVVNSTHAFATDYYSLNIIELTDTPSLIRSLETMENLGAPAIDDDRVFLVGSGRIDLIDIQPLLFPSAVGELSDGSFTVDVVGLLDETRSCATGRTSPNGTSVLRMFDVKDPAHPAAKGEVVTDDHVNDLVTGGGYAYASVNRRNVEHDLDVFDCRDLDAPRWIGTLAEGGGDLAVQDSFLYVATSELSENFFKVIDISSPDAPKVRSQLMTKGIREFEVNGSYAYAPTFEGEILIIDIADPNAPAIARSYDLPGLVSPIALAIEDNFAYVLAAEFFSSITTMAVLDISNPMFPVAVGDLDLPFMASDITANMGIVYVSSSTSLYIVDARFPQAPVFTSSASWDFEMRNMAINDQGIHVAGGDRYAILPLQCQGPQAVELGAFDAVAEPGAIRITWRTTMEEDHLGFHVERAMAEVGPFLRINRELIEPPGPYAHRDPDVRPGATYYYRLAALDRFGGIDLFGPRAATAIANDVTGGPPLRSALARSQPNPFTPASAQTAIRFTLAHPGPTTLRLYDPAGRLIQTLVDEPLPAGEHLATWDGRNAHGEAAAAGTYFYRLTAGDFTATHSLVRLR